MGYMIAITGKGGVGKTTIAALLVDRLIANGRSPVLAIDADPNSCLDSVLGVTVERTVGKIREEVRDSATAAAGKNIPKQQMLEMKIAECLVEAKDFDMIAMGRPEGPGCYCYANNVLREIISKISAEYPYIVLDNEAGLENLSRRIVRKVDLLVMVADPSKNGLETLKRLYNLAAEMKTAYKKLAIIINRTRKDSALQTVSELKELTGADYLLTLPDNEELASFAERGAGISGLSSGNEVVCLIDGFVKKLF